MADKVVWVACYHPIFLLLVEKHVKAVVQTKYVQRRKITF